MTTELTDPLRYRDVSIVACVDADRLRKLRPDAELDRFRPAAKQHHALVGIAADEATCVTIAISGDVMVAYVAFHPPSDIESWGEDRTGRILELGAIEVAPRARGRKLAERLLDASFAGGRFDHTVVIATLYVWHYDLRRTGLGDFAYKRLLEKLYGRVGLVTYPTADLEVRSSAANALMARIPDTADPTVVAEFHRLRTRPRFRFDEGSPD